MATCSIEGCTNPVGKARGWCNAHYLRWYRHGDPLVERKRAATGEVYAWLRDKVASGDRGECWEWPFTAMTRGYGRITVPGGQTRYATHVALELDGRPRPGRLHALHSCDNPPCVNPDHLRWGDTADNMADMFGRGRNNSTRKLTQAQADAIRKAKRSGVRADDLARDFGIAVSTVYDVCAGRYH